MRFLFLIVSILTGIYLPFICFIGVTFFYAATYTAYELFVVALCIDALFGYERSAFPYLYTIGVLCVVLITTFVKPYLRFYA